MFETDNTVTDHGHACGSFLYIHASYIAGSATHHLLEDGISLCFGCAAQGSAKDTPTAMVASISEGERCIVPGGTPKYLRIMRDSIEQVDALKHSERGINTAGNIVIVCGQVSYDFTARCAEAMNISQDLT